MAKYIKKLKLKNYKCYKDLCNGDGLEFSIPSEYKGSGLNILIGSNNSGKTALLSSLEKLKPEAIISEEDKNDLSKDVVIEILDSNDSIRELNSIRGNILKSTPPLEDLEVISFEDLDLSSDNRVWTPKIENPRNLPYNNYLSGTSIKREEIDRALASKLYEINKNDPEKKERINSLLKRIDHNFSDWYTTTLAGRSFVSYQLTSGKYISIDYSLGTGYLSLFRIVLALVEDRSVLVIDEPEAYLYPKAQIELSKILIEKSTAKESYEGKQIIISTHSPYIFKNPLKGHARLIKFEYDDGNFSIDNMTDTEWGLFGDESPTWGEINYYIYNLPTVEFHNELYGFLQSRKIKNDGKFYYQPKFDNFLGGTSYFEQSVPYDELQKDGSYKHYDCTLATYIRNKIHHPENTKNDWFSDSELRESTEKLIKLIEDLK